MIPVKVLLSYVAVGGGVLGVVGWRLGIEQPGIRIVGVLDDHSGSKLKPCASLAGVVERVVESPPVELSVFFTGDAGTADVPVLMSLPPVPQQTRFIKGRGRQLAERQAFVRDLAARCEQEATPATSPIFQGVRQALAHLRAMPGRGERRLDVISDLRETQEPRIAAALDGIPGTKMPVKLPTLDNAGIAVSVCGYAETTRKKENHGKKPPRLERVIEVWRRLFADPERVTFKPYCPSPTASLEER